MSAAVCPRAAEHTPMPGSYWGWFERAEQLAAAGFHQLECVCGRYEIWVAPPGVRMPEWPPPVELSDDGRIIYFVDTAARVVDANWERRDTGPPVFRPNPPHRFLLTAAQ